MTDIAVFSQTLASDDRSWDLTEPHQGAKRTKVLDVSLFTQAQHFPKGFIPSGTVIGLKTAGANGPYLDAASDGRQTATAITAAAVQVVNPDGSLKTKVAIGCYVAFADVDPAKLPFTSGNAANGGYIDANGKADLSLIHFGAQ